MLGLLWEDEVEIIPIPVNVLRGDAVVKGMVLRSSLFRIKLGKQKNRSLHEKIMQEVKSNHNFPHFSAMNSIDRIIRI